MFWLSEIVILRVNGEHSFVAEFHRNGSEKTEFEAQGTRNLPPEMETNGG